MTPEEYLDKKKSGRFTGGELYYTVSLDDAMKAVEMARSENKLDVHSWKKYQRS